MQEPEISFSGESPSSWLEPSVCLQKFKPHLAHLIPCAPAMHALLGGRDGVGLVVILL